MLVDGVWTQWQNSTCSKTCGQGGIIIQQRNCTPPQGNGSNCVGNKTREIPCNELPACMGEYISMILFS